MTTITVKRRLAEMYHDAKARPCADCAVEYPIHVMQLDHRPGSGKRFGVGAPLWAGSAEARDAVAAAAKEFGSLEAAFAAELAKCEVVCANCHAERTFQRRLAASVARYGIRQGGDCYGAGEVGGCRHARPANRTPPGAADC